MTRPPTRRLAAVAITAVLVAVVGAVLVTSGGESRATYVALGDSYTAFPGSASPIDAPCLRSGSNYPHLVAAALHYDLDDVSCGGATTNDLSGSQKSGVAPQFDALSANTRLVTVGIGVNNDGISTVLLATCAQLGGSDPTGTPCATRTEAWAKTVFSQLAQQLITSFEAIRARAPHARVIVIGYPQLLGSSGSCAKFPVAPGDVGYLDWFNAALNDTVQAAAQATGIDFLDLSQASMSHGICSTSPWVNGTVAVAGVAAAVHPFPAEQQAVAALLEQRLHQR